MVHLSPIWMNKKQTFSRLKGDIKTDILIIGGGLTGVSVAYHLLRKKKNVTLIEKNLIASGMTGQGTGILVPGFELDFGDMVKVYGMKETNRFWKVTMKSLYEIKSLIKRLGLKCDLHETGSITPGFSKSDVAVLKHEVELRCASGHPCKLFVNDEVQKLAKINAIAAMYSPIEAIFNQEKFVSGLAKYCSKNVKIFEKSPAQSITKVKKFYIVKTPHGKIRTKKIILAAAASDTEFIKPKHKLYKSTTFEIATKPLTKKQLNSIVWKKGHCIWQLDKTYDYDNYYDYIRLTKDKRIIVGGEDSKINLDSKRIKLHYKRLKKFLLELFPQLKDIKIDYEWSGTLHYTKKDFPEIGRKGNIFYAFAYGGHGLLVGFYAGKILAHWILGKPEKESKILIGK